MSFSSKKLKAEEDQIGFNTLNLFSIANNYNKWMFTAFASYCSGTTLEIGSGIGNISKYLLSNIERVTLSDISDGYCEILHQKFEDVHNLNGIYQIDISATNFEETYKALLNKFDTVIALNLCKGSPNLSRDRG